jgi:NAD-reducing hydrogenase large subunit
MGRKITIEPVTRIEGHGRVTIHLDDQGVVEQTFFHVDEFRGLEKFCEGRPYYEMPQITQRICGICPISHHLAASKACDAISRVQPTRTAKLLRELMHMVCIFSIWQRLIFCLALILTQQRAMFSE